MIAQAAANETAPAGATPAAGGEVATSPAGSIGDLFGDDLGSGAVLLGGVVALSILVFTFLSLRLLYRSTPQVDLPSPRWGLAEVLLAFGLWFVVQSVFVLGAEFIILLAPSVSWVAETGHPLELSLKLTALGLGGLAFAGLMIFVPRIAGQAITVLGIGTGSIIQGLGHATLTGLTIIPAALVIALLWQLVLHGFGVEPAPQDVVEEFSRAVSGQGTSLVFAIAFLTVIVAPITEELLFRAVLFRWLQKHLSTTQAIIASGVIFSACHRSLTAFLPLALLGILFAVILQRTGNLWTCIALHALFNGTNLVLMALAQLV